MAEVRSIRPWSFVTDETISLRQPTGVGGLRPRRRRPGAEPAPRVMEAAASAPGRGERPDRRERPGREPPEGAVLGDGAAVWPVGACASVAPLAVTG